VRLLTRNGRDWTGRFPWIAESALKNRQKQFVIDGEAVVLGVDGICVTLASTNERTGESGTRFRALWVRFRLDSHLSARGRPKFRLAGGRLVQSDISRRISDELQSLTGVRQGIDC
jgi:hypothetical protein